MKKIKVSLITVLVMGMIVLLIYLVPREWNVPDSEWLLWFCLAFLVYIAVLLTDRLK